MAAGWAMGNVRRYSPIVDNLGFVFLEPQKRMLAGFHIAVVCSNLRSSTCTRCRRPGVELLPMTVQNGRVNDSPKSGALLLSLPPSLPTYLTNP